jgi:hypothetical protein
MKYICTLLLVYVFFPILPCAQVGSTCSNPHILTMDGVSRSYATSASTGNAVVCSSISGSSPITYFRFTTNASAQMPLLDIVAPSGTNCEVAMYAGACTNGNLQDASSMCFYDGEGLWAPAHDYTLAPNTVYNLRIKTATAGNIQITAQFYTPPNNDCAGATPIGPYLVNDNNATHRTGPGITPGQLCASTLENTAFYSFTVENNGSTTLSIENATCDNGNGVNSIGFQVGFFTGSCTSLFYLGCYAGFGSNIQIVTAPFTAGDKIYVAVDGIGGSNCKYGVRAINSIELMATLKYFTALKRPDGNMLKWVSLREMNNESFDVQRSVDGKDFTTIGTVLGQLNSNSEKNYEFNDLKAPEHCYYRLKKNSTTGKFTYSNVIRVDRSGMTTVKVKLNNPVSGELNMIVTSSMNSEADIIIRNINGIVVYRDKIRCIKGDNTYTKDFSFLNTGMYTVTTLMDNLKDTRSFIKMHN